MTRGPTAADRQARGPTLRLGMLGGRALRPSDQNLGRGRAGGDMQCHILGVVEKYYWFLIMYIDRI
jgi:hypothetical protein